jgi:hypothetical protein
MQASLDCWIARGVDVTCTSLNRRTSWPNFLHACHHSITDDVWVLDRSGDIVACVVVWDWSQITRVTVTALPLRLRALGAVLDALRRVRPVPRLTRLGETWKQWGVVLISLEKPDELRALLRHVNNQAMRRGADQIVILREQDDRYIVAPGAGPE